MISLNIAHDRRWQEDQRVVAIPTEAVKRSMRCWVQERCGRKLLISSFIRNCLWIELTL